VTTSAGVVAQRLVGHSARRPLVIFSTYHSVHVVAEAARSVGVVVDLVIADEAHTLAGQPRREFQVVLSDELPARTRVFLTATQVVAGAADDVVVGAPARLSMDDAALFGPVAYRLDFADAITRGLLADYQVLVYETPGQRLLPDPVAALATAAGQGVSSVLSFHGRVAKARAFAAALDGLVLADGRTVVARAVAGIDPTRQREHALALLAAARPDRLVVISSARCLSAGIDIPAVDGVLFADPKNSDVDVIQSVGPRAGLVMIPVCVPAGLDDDSALSTGAFAAVWRILRGLRSMDRRLAAELEMISRQPPRRGVPDGSRRVPRVHFDFPSIADPARLYARVVDFVSPAWDNTLREVEQFAAEHGHVGIARGTRLGEWCERQRRAYRSGMLAPERAGRLSALPGWAWDPAAQRWLEQWAQVLAVADECGQLTVDDPQMAQRELHRPERRARVNTIGRWCAAQRQLARRGELGSWQFCKLDEIPGWNREAISAEDAAAVDLLGEYVAWKGHANPPADFIEDDVPLGQWLNTVRRRRATGHLTQPLLDEITIVCPSSDDGALRWYRGATLWLLGLEALRQFVAREGHCRPPYSHVEQLSDFRLPLYDWCTRQRHLYRHGQMIAARAHKLETVEGWQWERQPTPACCSISATPATVSALVM
jgi:Helicase associated domain